MTRIKFTDLPDESTPHTAENMNKLNNLAISTTIEGHDEEVVFIKGENQKSEIYANGKKYSDTLSIGTEPNNAGLWVDIQKGFDKTTSITGKAIAGGDGTLYDATDYSTSDYILLKEGTYVGTGFNRYAIYKANDKTFVSSGTTTTFTLASDSYVRLQYLTANVNSVNISIPSSVKVNNNGVYEIIVNKNIYSTNEVVIGEWFGKPLYIKAVNFGALPSNNTKNVAHGIINYQHIHLNIGKSYWTHKDNDLFNTNVSNSFVYTGFISEFGVNGANISIKTNNVNASNFNALIFVEYTKKTD